MRSTDLWRGGGCDPLDGQEEARKEGECGKSRMYELQRPSRIR